MTGFWSGKKVLVTGACGFIGSHLAERLIQEGASVKALVHYNSLQNRGWLHESANKASIHFVDGDLTDPFSVDDAAKDQEVIFHLGALIAIPYSYIAPESYVRTNVGGTLNVLQAAKRHGTQRVIQTSTSEVYGTARFAPITEEHPLQGQSPYSASKIGADKMAEAFHLSFNVPVTIVRPFNTFGPRQSARAVIPTIISQFLAKGEAKLGNLTPTRDLNYVSNTVDGFLAAAESPKTIGKTVHFGSNREISIGDLAVLIAKLMGIDARVTQDDVRVRPEGSEVERLIASNTFAQELLDWSPKVTLEDGLLNTIAWIKENQNAYDPNRYTV